MLELPEPLAVRVMGLAGDAPTHLELELGFGERELGCGEEWRGVPGEVLHPHRDSGLNDL